MTLEEKINRVHTHFGPLPDFTTGYMAPLDRLDLPRYTMADGPVGVRHPFLVDEPNPGHLATVAEDETTLFVNSISGGPSTAFPATISQASTWNTDRLH